ncbi:phosphatase PAP2 family protein [Belnapia rosea]|uniref:Undecaprenyl-diphosphatase n=1 Tax=Belnapia rosea TaxID=938405 RepID=A0A1G6JU65_9PROT|nr:phosphatase PAP2 family protein [Belnapia rosea]SDB14187.1 undecaprenyl-diphosphatase [Belnapia rosea]SDC22292.1 undecaprenyl-diphosphatase [Belnapia rosea]
MLEQLDLWVTRSVNEFAGHSAFFDKLITQIFFYHTVKALPIVAVFFSLWLSSWRGEAGKRLFLQGTIGAFTAMVISRLIQNNAPNKPRPMYALDDFTMPIDQPRDVFQDWSSFPSDTAAVVFALSFAVWRADRRVGLACFAWSVVIVCFPRLYGGIHYFSDLVAGAAIGMAATAAVIHWRGLSDLVHRLATGLERRHRLAFGIAMLMLAFQFATMFEEARIIGRRAHQAMTMAMGVEAKPASPALVAAGEGTEALPPTR